MSLVPISKAKISLPTVTSSKIIGKNNCIRYVFKTLDVEVNVYDSTEYKGWYELVPTTYFPWGTIYLPTSKSLKIAPPKGYLQLQYIPNLNIEELATRELHWAKDIFLQEVSSPTAISNSWQNIFSFREDNPETDSVGLRLPQIGALHALSAYFSLKKNTEPATIVLPTGIGKTETMLAFMVYRSLAKVLVVVPSNTLRSQISKKFLELGYLPQLGVIPLDAKLPAVTEMKHTVSSNEEADSLLEYSNVIIATPNVITKSPQDAICRLCNGIHVLFIDEAHHSSAKTWQHIRTHFSSKKVIQFTATPFRNDNGNLGGKIIYNYTMGEAQRAGYFKHIELIAVEEYSASNTDSTIAQRAITRLRTDLSNGFDHILMARVDKQERASKLLEIYEQLGNDLHPVIIHSELSPQKCQESLNALKTRASRIVICVNMLGEGFDFPNLKVAAIHDIHKSLAITLQFIGRFTRQGGRHIGDASIVVNLAEPEVENELENLYSLGVEWDEVLSTLSEKRIEREVKLQELIEKLKEQGDLHEQISLWNLHPSFSAILFKTSCSEWSPQSFSQMMPPGCKYWPAIGHSDKILIVLALQQAPIKWGNYKDMFDSIHKLLIIKWDNTRSAAFAYSNDYKWFKVERIMKAIFNTKCELLSGESVFNVFNGLNFPLVRNLGASQVGAISFTQYFGPNVTDGLSKIEKEESYLSNIAGLGYENGERVIWGCSQKKGKIWSVSGGNIVTWSEWVTAAWDKVISGDVDINNITKDFLKPQSINKHYEQYACAISWGEHIGADPEDGVTILFDDKEIPMYFVDLKIADNGPICPYSLEVINEGNRAVYNFEIDDIPPKYHYSHFSGPRIRIKRGNGEPVDFEEYLNRDPLIIQYVDGSFSYNCFLIKVKESLAEFLRENIETWSWDNIDITKESMGKTVNRNTVQWRAFEYYKDDYDIIINDDGPGEAADLIMIKSLEESIRLDFVHCKFSSEPIPGKRISDFYEVCGQAQKSIQWKFKGFNTLYTHIKKRNENWHDHSRFLKGSIPDLLNVKRRARIVKLDLHITVIQPGGNKESLSHDILKLLGCTEEYLKKTAQAEFSVVCS